jgi:hypothetical protein
MNLRDLVDEYKRAGYDKYRLSGGQLVDAESGTQVFDATPEDIQRFKEYQQAQLQAANEPDVMPAAARPAAAPQPTLSNLVKPAPTAPSLSQDYGSGNETSRLSQYAPTGRIGYEMPAEQAGPPTPEWANDPANIRMNKMLSGDTTGRWTNEGGRRTLTMKGGPRAPEPTAADVFRKQAMQVLQDPNIPMAQKIQVYQVLNKGQDLDSVKKGLEIDKLRKEIAKPADINKSQIPGTIENERVLKRQDIARKGQMAEQSALDDSKKLQGFLKQAIDQTDWNSAGMIGQVMSTFGGTDATDLESVLDSIKAKIGFKELQDMRRESPTGGALGQVAVKELEFLQSVEGSLKQKQSPDQLRSNLQAILDSAARLEQDLQKNPPTWDYNTGASVGGATIPASGGKSGDTGETYEQWKARVKGSN